MTETLGSAIVLVLASLLVGQAVLCVCGWRRVSALAPAVGLAVLVAVGGFATRVGSNDSEALGSAWIGAQLVVVLLVAALAVLAWRRPEGFMRGARIGIPVAVVALAVALIPFAAEGRFGILGTGFNPDMQQHLLIAGWFLDMTGEEPFFIPGGYPVGPHGLVTTLALGLEGGGVDPDETLIRAFDGLTVAIAPLTALTALGALRGRSGRTRTVVAVLCAFAYLAAAFLAQGAFKETIMALFLVAFAVGLAGLTRPLEGAPASAVLGALPLALLAVGTIYVYSFPGLAWLVGTAVVWALFEVARRREAQVDLRTIARHAVVAVGASLILFAVLSAPEWTRMVEFSDFRAFDPPGRGLGNLFDSLSPLEAFGVWPTGDYRLDPGEGSVPAVLYYLGAALGAIGLGWGLVRWWGTGERAFPAALGAAAVVYAGAAAFGTPYTAAKGLAVAAPLVVLLGMGGLLTDRPPVRELVGTRRLFALALAAALAGSSVLALGRAQIGPTSYTADFVTIRPIVKGKGVLALIPAGLADQRGEEFVRWELRGSVRRIEIATCPTGRLTPRGFQYVVAPSLDGCPPVLGKRRGQYPDVPFRDACLSGGGGETYGLWRVGRPGPRPCR